MKGKRLLAGLLVGMMIVCFVSGAGYGEIKATIDQTRMITECLSAQIEYIMSHPTSFLYVMIYYDQYGFYAARFPEGLDIDTTVQLPTKDKICISIFDNRSMFSDKSEEALLMQFKIELEAVWSCPSVGTLTDYKSEDTVALFYSRELVFLGYFYQGEYHLWEE